MHIAELKELLSKYENVNITFKVLREIVPGRVKDKHDLGSVEIKPVFKYKLCDSILNTIEKDGELVIGIG